MAGCVSKGKAKADAHAAFVAGQQDAIRRMERVNASSVTINGPVANSRIPWTEDLTLAKALFAAQYAGHADPKEILIVRQGIAIRVDLRQFLAGQDMPLLAGDIVQITP
jgi:hypothetical protein